MSEEIIDSYLTLGSHYSHEIKIKGSRFIAHGYPVDDAKAAAEILEEIRKKEYAATHYCFARVVGLEKEDFKYSDDGEPSGTAGKPIYQAIVGRRLKNIIVIVVRYFGGTKLGTGGLARAYSRAATEMLDKADIVERLICDHLRFSIPFSHYDRFRQIISAGKYQVISQDFADQVSLEVAVRKSETDLFISRLTEMTGGRIDIRKND